MEAVRVYTSYDLPDEKGETRRERNIKFGQEDKNPDFEIPLAGEYLWDWFTRLSNAIHRVDFNGYYYNLLPSEILAWCKLANVEMTEDEYDIITAMDSSFCNELNADIHAKNTSKMEEMDKKVKRGR